LNRSCAIEPRFEIKLLTDTPQDFFPRPVRRSSRSRPFRSPFVLRRALTPIFYT
jgi:hypothetical protein